MSNHKKIRQCTQIVDIFQSYPEFNTHFVTKKNEADVRIECKYYHAQASRVTGAPKLSTEQQNKVFQILQDNMKSYYERSKSMPWNAVEKKEEIFGKNIRFLVSFDGDHIIGFAAFMFDIEDKRIVLYLYELQIIKKYQKCGLGSFMMNLVEQIAKNTGMSYVMLTVFRHNESAMDFYTRKYSYVIDRFSPSKSGSTDKDYEIISKQIL